MTYISNKGFISINNSTITVLTAGSTFTGTGEDVSTYPTVTVAVKTDVASILYIDFSPDNTNWDSTLTYTVAAGINEVHRLSVTRKYFRVRLMNNGASTQTYLRLQSIIGSQEALSAPLNLSTQLDADAINVRVNDYPLQVQRDSCLQE